MFARISAVWIIAYVFVYGNTLICVSSQSTVGQFGTAKYRHSCKSGGGCQYTLTLPECQQGVDCQDTCDQDVAAILQTVTQQAADIQRFSETVIHMSTQIQELSATVQDFEDTSNQDLSVKIREMTGIVQQQTAEISSFRNTLSTQATAISRLRNAFENIPSPLACQPGWIQFRSSYFGYVHNLYNYEDAKTVCEVMGSTLVIVNDAEENLFLKGYLWNQEHIWIGLNDILIEGHFVWVDGSPVTYSNWNGREPSNSYNREDCVSLKAGLGGKWNDATCSDKMGFICEKDSNM